MCLSSCCNPEFVLGHVPAGLLVLALVRWVGRALSEGTAVSGVCPNPAQPLLGKEEQGEFSCLLCPSVRGKVSHGMKAVEGQQALPAQKMGALPQSGGGHRAAPASESNWVPTMRTTLVPLIGSCCLLGKQGSAGLSCHTFSTDQQLIVNRFSSFFFVLLLHTAAMSVLFSIPFSRYRYASFLFSMDSILPCTYSEIHLPVSPSQEVSFHLVYVDNQPALSSTVHCLFPGVWWLFSMENLNAYCICEH